MRTTRHRPHWWKVRQAAGRRRRSRWYLYNEDGRRIVEVRPVGGWLT